jgi:hypothetical protein
MKNEAISKFYGERRSHGISSRRECFRTATPEERSTDAIAVGYTPLECEVIRDGFSMRELMQALKRIEVKCGSPIPDDLLTACFELFACLWLGRKELISVMPEIITKYRTEPPMPSEERANAILKDFGIVLLDDNKPEDMQKWKEVARVRTH